MGRPSCYLPHAEGEVELRKKIDPSLRDGIFIGYRSHTGGRWADQCEVIGFEAYAKIPIASGRKACAHAVSDVYILGSTGDD